MMYRQTKQHPRKGTSLGARVPFIPATIAATTLAQTFAGSMLGAQTTAEGSEAPESADVELDAAVLRGDHEAELKLSSPRFTAPLLDTPQTVNVVSSETIQQQGATSLQDVLRNSPGITFRAGEGGAPAGDNLFIRGSSATNDVFVDGVRSIGEQSRDAYNLEQVEVSKGPSSAQNGRGAAGGSINLVTKTPKMETATSVSTTVGTDAYLRGTFDTNHVISEEKGIAFRILGMATDADVPRRDVVTQESWAINPTISFGLDTDTRFTLGYERFQDKSHPDYGMPTDAIAMGVDLSNYYGIEATDFSDITSDKVKFDVEHDFGANFTVRNTMAYVRTQTQITATATGGITGNTVSVSHKSRDRVVDNFTNQTTLSGDFETGSLQHRFALGLDLSKETYKAYDLTPWTYAPSRDKDLYDPRSTVITATGGGQRTGDYTEVKSETAALFLGDTIALSEKWDLNGNARLEHYKVNQKDTNTPASNGLGTEDTLFSWRGGIVFKPVENGSLYFGMGKSLTPASASSSNGFSFSTRNGNTANPDVDPLETTSYELGTKWALLDNRLNISAAFFYTELENDITVDPITSVAYQSGTKRTQGFELGIGGQITDRWSVTAGFTVLDSEIDSLDTSNGNSASYVPETTVNLWSTYALTNDFSVGGGLVYSGDVSYTDNGTAPPSEASYTLYSAMASYQVNEQLSLQLNVDNLTDEAYISKGSSRRSVPGAGRSAKLTLNYKF